MSAFRNRGVATCASQPERSAAQAPGGIRPCVRNFCTPSSFAEHGNIKRENVWLDLASIIQQLPQN